MVQSTAATVNVLTLKDAAKKLEVSEKKLRQTLLDKGMDNKWKRGRWRIPAEALPEIQKWLKEKRKSSTSREMIQTIMVILEDIKESIEEIKQLINPVSEIPSFIKFIKVVNEAYSKFNTDWVPIEWIINEVTAELKIPPKIALIWLDDLSKIYWPNVGFQLFELSDVKRFEIEPGVSYTHMHIKNGRIPL